MSFWKVLHLVAIGLSVLAAIGVLRNPLRVTLNALAGFSYIASAILALVLNSWWPIPAGWIVSLTLQWLMARRMAKGVYNVKINAKRKAQGLSPLGETMKYFAYGSNMLEERLRSPNRVPGATFWSTGSVPGHRLRFHKSSTDGSGKCNMENSARAEDVVYGVVFEIPEDELEALDTAEGTGQGYHQDENIRVQLANRTEMPVLTYIADPSAIDDGLIPYAWYHALVIAGAEQHRLPQEYIANLQQFAAFEDPIPNRTTKLEAEAALRAYHNNTVT